MSSIVNRRRVYGKPVPYDARVEYLEGGGLLNNSYIDTGYVPNGTNVRMCTKLTWLKTDKWWNTGWFGAGVSINGKRNLYGVYTFLDKQTNLGISYNGNLFDSKFSVQQEGTYEIDLRNNICTINGQDILLPNGDAELENTYSVRLFMLNSTTGNQIDFYGRFYYFQIWEDDNLIMDLIPVRISTTGYMYDKVSGKFFGNQGTGEFILGPDVK